MKWKTEGSFSVTRTDSGLHLLVHSTKKFKTSTLRLYCRNPLDGNATRNALLPFVLRRGTRSLPDTAAITRRLDDLYGASFGVDLLKIGERQMLEFRLQILDDRFLRGGARLLEAGLRFLHGVLRDPLLQDGAFHREHFRTEKHHLRRLIESRINDKSRYAAERLIEEMCRDEPYGIHEYGRVDALRRLGPRDLYRYYAEWSRSVPIDLYVVGKVVPERLGDVVARVFDAPGDRRAGERALGEVTRRRPRRVRRITECQDVSQGKLALGLRTSLAPADPAMPALQLASVVLGGGAFSKLFRLFREKESLAYSADASLERIKGLVTIQAGIDPQNYDRAMRVIRRQIRDVTRGKISSFELESAREHVLHRIRSLEDSPAGLIRSTLVARECGRPLTVRQGVLRYRRISLDQIVEAAGSLALDTVFFLRGTGGRKGGTR